MKSIAELKTELRDARSKLQWIRPVAWAAPIEGMNEYGDQLALVTRLTVELNRLKSQGHVT